MLFGISSVALVTRIYFGYHHARLACHVQWPFPVVWSFLSFMLLCTFSVTRGQCQSIALGHPFWQKKHENVQ